MSDFEILANKYSRGVTISFQKARVIRLWILSGVDCNSFMFIKKLKSYILHNLLKTLSLIRRVYTCMLNREKQVVSPKGLPVYGGSGVLPRKIFILKIVCGAFWRISEHFLKYKTNSVNTQYLSSHLF